MSQGINPDTIERSMFDVLVHRVPIEDIIAEREVDVAVASIDLAGAELALSSMMGRERALEKALATVRDKYDYILIDTPPSLGLLTINAFVASTGVIVPVQCEYLALRGLVQLENTLAMVRENLNPQVEIVGILPTMYDKRTLHSREAVEILRENFGDLVLQHEDPQDGALRRGAGQGLLGASLRLGSGRPRSSTATWRRRCSMARKRASMREGRLAELFRATEAAQRQAEREAVDAPKDEAAGEPQEETVEHVPVFDEPPAAARAPRAGPHPRPCGSRRRRAAREPEPPAAARPPPRAPEPASARRSRSCTIAAGAAAAPRSRRAARAPHAGAAARAVALDRATAGAGSAPEPRRWTLRRTSRSSASSV